MRKSRLRALFQPATPLHTAPGIGTADLGIALWWPGGRLAVRVGGGGGRSGTGGSTVPGGTSRSRALATGQPTRATFTVHPIPRPAIAAVWWRPQRHWWLHRARVDASRRRSGALATGGAAQPAGLRAMELLLLLGALCSWAASGTAPPACSGNGQRLSDGAGLSCSCRKPWTGPDCAVLGLAPARVRNGFGQDDHSSVSWGAGVVFHPEDSLYHMYVLEVLHNCPLCTFGSNSQLVHATAKQASGPFTRQGVVLPAFTGNPQPVLASDNKTIALFHTGGGTSSSHPRSLCNCSSSGPTKKPDCNQCHISPDVAGYPLPLTAATAAHTLHVATSPWGPWHPVNPAPPRCNNPAPIQHPNGTWLLLCNNVGGAFGLQGQYPLYSAPELEGPWTLRTRLPILYNISRQESPRVFEDPFMYIDQAGVWHVLWHVFNRTFPCGACMDNTVSGHHYSNDGLTWHESSPQPFGNTVQFQGGHGEATFSTRERPFLIRGPGGRPTHLVSAVCTAVSCAPMRRSECKSINHDYTLVQPLQLDYVNVATSIEEADIGRQ
jgi:hypothetical protein